MLLYFSGLGTDGIPTTGADWNIFTAGQFLLDPTIAKMAFAFVLIGYGTKMGLVPMHTWLPDAHSKAPIPVSALLSGLLLNIAFFAIIRFRLITDAAVGVEFTSSLLIGFGTLSVAVAAFMILAQKNYKRLLAYSSIEHMGLIALGFGLGGGAIFAAILHLIYHTLTNTILFLSAGNIFLQYSSTKIEAVRGMRQALPITSVVFVMGALAITGTPPFGTFLTEFSILAASTDHYPWVTVIILGALSIIFIGFLTHLSAMLTGELPKGVGKVQKNVWRLIPLTALLLLLITLSVYLPAPVIRIIDQVASTQ
jgi:hydrogenase-4 component F